MERAKQPRRHGESSYSPPFLQSSLLSPSCQTLKPMRRRRPSPHPRSQYRRLARGGDRARRGPDVGSRTRRSPIRADGLVDSGNRVAAARRHQPDRHNLHAHGRCGRDEILLYNPRAERRRRNECMAARLRLHHRTRGDGTRDIYAYAITDRNRGAWDVNTHADSLCALDTGAVCAGELGRSGPDLEGRTATRCASNY